MAEAKLIFHELKRFVGIEEYESPGHREMWEQHAMVEFNKFVHEHKIRIIDSVVGVWSPCYTDPESPNRVTAWKYTLTGCSLSD